MRVFGYPYNDLVICKDGPDYLLSFHNVFLLGKDIANIMVQICRKVFVLL